MISSFSSVFMFNIILINVLLTTYYYYLINAVFTNVVIYYFDLVLIIILAGLVMIYENGLGTTYTLYYYPFRTHDIIPNIKVRTCTIKTKKDKRGPEGKRELHCVFLPSCDANGGLGLDVSLPHVFPVTRQHCSS